MRQPTDSWQRISTSNVWKHAGHCLVAFAFFDFLGRYCSNAFYGVYVTYALAFGLCVVLMIRPSLFLVLFGLAIVLFNDVSPEWYMARDPYTLQFTFKTIHTLRVGPLTLVNYIFVVVACFSVAKLIRSRTIRVTGDFLLLASVLVLRMMTGLLNLTEATFSYYMSDLGPFVTYVFYYLFVNLYTKNVESGLNLLGIISFALQGKSLAYAANVALLTAIGELTDPRFAPDTLLPIQIAVSLAMPFLVSPPSVLYQIASYGAFAGGLLLLVGQPGSAQTILVLSSVGLLIMYLGFFYKQGLRIRVWGQLLGFGMVGVIAFTLVPMPLTFFSWKLANILSLFSTSPSSFTPTVNLRYLELLNILSELSRQGPFALLGGLGAASYFTFSRYPAPRGIYNTVGAYSTIQLLANRFYTPHDFINASLLKTGLVGLVCYCLAFVVMGYRMFKKSIKHVCNNEAWPFLVLALIITPELLYNLHWGNKVAIFAGLYIGSVEVATRGKLERAELSDLK